MPTLALQQKPVANAAPRTAPQLRAVAREEVSENDGRSLARGGTSLAPPPRHGNGPSSFGHSIAKLPSLSSAPLSLKPKLKINQPGDKYEQEADRVADMVMRMPEPTVQRKCSCGGGGCSKCNGGHSESEHELLQMKRVDASSLGPDEAPPIVHEVLQQPGRPLDEGTRSFMESRFGYDFGAIRVHDGAEAATSANAIRARAYALGSHVVVGAREPSLATSLGRSLLAHELTHVVQQGAAQPAQQSAGALGGVVQPVAPQPTTAGTELRRQPDSGPSSTPTAPPATGLDPSTNTFCRIQFRQGSTTAADPAEKEACLETVSAYVKAAKGGVTVELHGYASEEGSSRSNASLASRRSEAIKRLLVGLGVSSPAISAIGHGEDGTYPALTANRRVDIVLTKSLSFEGDEITIPKFICGPDVTKQVGDAVGLADALFTGWTSDQRNEACEDLRGVSTGQFAWDIVNLHNNAWILGYRPVCATQGATPPCGSSVQVGNECYYAGSPNYVIFGTMCALCHDHFRAQNRAGANAGYTGWMDFTTQSMLDLIDLYKSSSDNVGPSKAWAVAGRDGWPSGGSPPSGDRPGCAPQCSQPYTGGDFQVNWYPYEFHGDR